jgi:hypothetical protein
MKSFKNFSDLHEKKKDLNLLQRGVLGLGDIVKKGIRTVVPEPSRSNEPAVRSGDRTPQTGFGHTTSFNRKGQAVDGETRPEKARRAPPKRTDKDDEITARNQKDRSKNPAEFFGTNQYGSGGSKDPKTKTKTKADTKDSSNYTAADAAADQERAKNAANKSRLAKQTRDNPPSSPKPKKPSAKNDTRNAEYVTKRAAANAATGDAKKKATKDAESAGMAAWKKANPKLAAAKAKRDATRGTSKSTNPLMQKYIKDRKSRNAGNEKARQDAKAASIAQSPNADKINKKQTERQASVDKAIKSVNTPKTPPAVVPANTGSGRDGTFGSGTSGKGMPSNPPIRAKAPEVKTPTPIKVEPYQGKSKGGEVKKKTKKESFLGFADYLVEKKTKIKLNPKKDDLLEGGCGSYSKGGDVKKNHGEDCDCMKCQQKRRKDDLGDEKTVSTEGYAYVSQEEVSEEGYQEGYETETDLTEASFDIGPGHRGAMKGKKIYDKGKGTTNPNEKDAFMKRTGPQLPLAKGKKSLETAGYEPEGDQIDEALPGSIEAKKGSTYDSKKDFKSAFKANPGAFKSPLGSMGGGKVVGNRFQVDKNDDEQGFVPIPQMPRGRPGQYGTGPSAYRPMSAFTQKMMYKSPIFGGGKGKGGFYKAAMKANNVSIANNKPTTSGPKPKPMQAGRPGFNNSGAPKPSVNKPPSPSSSPSSGGPKPIKKVPTGKKPGSSSIDWSKFNESSRLRSFGVINALSEDRGEDAKKSLERVKKRQGVLDDYEKKTGKKLDINKSVEAREHQKNFPGAKRTSKKKRGEKESELETHNRRVNKYTERLLKHGKTKKQKKDDDAMAKHTSRFD